MYKITTKGFVYFTLEVLGKFWFLFMASKTFVWLEMRRGCVTRLTWLRVNDCWNNDLCRKPLKQS